MNDREKVEIQKKKALELLTDKPIKSTLTERWFLLDEACELYGEEPQPLALGKGLGYILTHASLPIDECDILLGRYVDRVPTEEEERRLADVWQRRVKNKNPITRYNGGHLTLDWETLVGIGITGYIERTRKRIERAKEENADTSVINWLEGMRLVYEAIREYIVRYAEAARASGNTRAAEVCENLADNPPRTFREAMQLILFVFTVYMIYGGWRVACLTLGRMDKYLLPFYLDDIRSGRATEEDIACVIDDFQCKMSLHLGRGEHQMTYHLSDGNITGWDRNQVFDSPTYIVIDGYSEDGVKDNPLTKLFARLIVPKFKNPVYIYRWSDTNSDEVKRIICDKMRQNAAILAYNDGTMIPAMRHVGVEERDAVNYTIHPCNWPDIAGGYSILGQVGDTIPHMMYDAFFGEEAPRAEFSSMEELYSRYEEYYRELVRNSLEAIRSKSLITDSTACERLNLDDCFLTGPMEMTRSSMYGGVKYPAVYMLIRNIGTAADMMAAMESVVFKEKKATLDELYEAMRNNFEGRGDLLALCRRAPKYGVDNDIADGHAVRLMTLMLDVIDELTNDETQGQRLYPLCVTITDMDHLHNGKRLAATPDGRLAYEPLSENLSPTVGYYESVTALLNSVAKLPFNRLHSGALNLRLREELVAGDEGLERMWVLMNTYFKNGGMQLQTSVADTEILRKAQKCPECYRDLRVRITGYSAVFVDMSKNGQDEIIRREELGN